MRKVVVLALAVIAADGSFVAASAAGSHDDGRPTISAQHIKNVLMVRGGTCKTVNSCEEAVELWCGGYRRADGDSDGVPCENVCGSKSEVDRIKQKIGC